MPWKTIPDYSDYELSSKAVLRRKSTNYTYNIFLKYGRPHVTLERDDGLGRNLCIRTLMAELWPKATEWDRWVPYQDNSKELQKKARVLLKEGVSPRNVSEKTGISIGDLIYMRNRL